MILHIIIPEDLAIRNKTQLIPTIEPIRLLEITIIQTILQAETLIPMEIIMVEEEDRQVTVARMVAETLLMAVAVHRVVVLMVEEAHLVAVLMAEAEVLLVVEDHQAEVEDDSKTIPIKSTLTLV